LSITFEPRAGDARALVVSLGFGALIGAAIGGAYIVGGVAREAVSKPLLAQANGIQVPAPVAGGASAVAGQLPSSLGGPVTSTSTAVSLRDRFSVALALTRSVVQPFHFKTGDAGAGDHARDTQCLAQAVYYEARGETPSGQAAVAQVVLNRVRHPAFPKTICGVVFQHVGDDCQFSFACNGAMRQPLDQASWRRAMAVANRALSGAVMAKVAQIGEHIFYRFTGRAGTPRMFKAEAQPSAPDIEAKADADRVHAVFTVATASQAPATPAAKPLTVDAKVSATAPAPTPATSMPKAVEPTAKAPQATAGDSAQPVKTAVPETSKPIAATATQS
jgi:hypothetical protein